MEKSNSKIALVTGGGSGLGLAISQRLSQAGYTTLIVGRDQQKLEEATKSAGDNCSSFVCDLSDLSGIPKLVSEIVRKYGRIDVLVNNAGINLKKDFVEVSDADFQQILTTNLISVFSLSREVVKQMINQGSGSIINISSMAAIYGLPRVIAYTASKAAIDGMTRAMAVELSPKGIRVNSIAPGFIETAMTAKALDSDPERKKKVMSRTPMGTMGKPNDIAEAALFFASEASRFITGTILPVDGGNSIGF